MDIFKILNNDTTGLTEEEKAFAEHFNNNLRDTVIDELVIYETNNMIQSLKNDEESFREKIEEILINGKKGYKDMPTKTLIDIYLDKKSEVDFINLIEKVSSM